MSVMLSLLFSEKKGETLLLSLLSNKIFNIKLRSERVLLFDKRAVEWLTR